MSAAFGLATLVTLLNANGLLLLQPDQLDLSPGSVLSALPGTILFFLLLGMTQPPLSMFYCAYNHLHTTNMYPCMHAQDAETHESQAYQPESYMI